MTDLQRHLKGIRKILSQTLDQTPEPKPIDLEAMKEAIRAFLPKSYGIGIGRIVGECGISEPVSLLLYDVPLAKGMYSAESTEYRIEHVLCLINVARTYTAEALRTTLDTIASVKRLQTFRPTEARARSNRPASQTRATIPRDRLPFALITADRFEPSSESALFDELHDLLQQHPLDQRPDDITLIGQQVTFTNPLLTEDAAEWFDMGWARVPARRKPEDCYICKREFMTRHFFYAYMCPRCGDLNYQKRRATLDLQGYRVLITGARVKIGYATALRLLRAGAEVIVTSRFPRDTARRYTQEADFDQWGHRLHVYGVDLRAVTSLEHFIQHLYARYPYLDAIINNAAQTVKRPLAYYAHLLPYETAPLAELPVSVQGILPEQSLSPVTADDSLTISDPNFPVGQYDEDGQQVDYRDFNSWVMKLEDIPVSELVEVHLVNAVAPAILAGQLKHLLKQSPHEARFILNVSAAEGRFSQHKTRYHPHTNMAKAALNMLTRTIAEDYAEDRIYVSSVDPGWVSDQIPYTGEMSRLASLDRLPLDMIDAAARVCDPMFTGVQMGQFLWGKLWKDYAPATW